MSWGHGDAGGRGAVHVDAMHDAIVRDGIVTLPEPFSPEWVDGLHADFEIAFSAARRSLGGTIDRGTERHYLAVHPERIGGFVELVTHPTIAALSNAVLGPDYQFVELAFDVPLPGATDQPWHRDFRTPTETRDERRLTSLAFNVSTVDVTHDLAPFEIAPGTHWETGDDFAEGMFPPPDVAAARYGSLGRRCYPKRGSITARTGLTLHRGTANRGDRARPVLILGVVAARSAQDKPHCLLITRTYHGELPGSVRDRLRCRLVDELEPLRQTHHIDGLRAGS